MHAAVKRWQLNCATSYPSRGTPASITARAVSSVRLLASGRLVRASQAYAYINGRDFVKPDDVKAVAVPVLHHRVVLAPEARITKENADDILTALVRKARIPKE